MNASRPSVVTILPRRFELPLHHHLRGNARVIGAGLPQRVVAAQAFESNQNVLQGES